MKGTAAPYRARKELLTIAGNPSVAQDETGDPMGMTPCDLLLCDLLLFAGSTKANGTKASGSVAGGRAGYG